MNMVRRTLFLSVLILVPGLTLGTSARAQSAPTLHYSWVAISGDTVLAPGESVVLGLQAEFTNADGYAGGNFTIRMDNFVNGDDSVWVAGTRGVDNLSNNGDQHNEVHEDGVGRIPIFRNNPPSGGERYTLLDNQILGNSSQDLIELLQFGLPGREPDRANPIIFFTMEFFAGDALGQRVLRSQPKLGMVYSLNGSLDIPLVIDKVTTGPITLTVIPAPASLAILSLTCLSYSKRKRSVL